MSRSAIHCLTSGHNSRIIFPSQYFLNSFPLSLCRICGGPMRQKMSRRIDVTSAAVFFLRGRRTINFVRWSWYTSKKLYGSFIARLVCMSMRSTCPLDAKSELRMGLVTVLFRDFLDFWSWHSGHIPTNFRTIFLENPANCFFNSVKSLSLPRCLPSSLCTVSNRLNSSFLWHNF